MGVYHLMGLGRSPGAITGPISYLAQRYVRYDEQDREFFGSSGEEVQREAGQRIGNIQAIVLFTTVEILEGSLSCFDYVDNPPGRTPSSLQRIGGAAMRKVLPNLIRREWEPMARQHAEDVRQFQGKTVAQLRLPVYWCVVNRRNILDTFEKVALITVALRRKELWANLTGGTNVLNFALELAATLTGEISRLYYVQAQDRVAEQCIRYTAENGYWVELPAMPLNLSRVIRAVIDILDVQPRPVSERELYSRLLQDEQHWSLLQGVSPDGFRNDYLRPMWKQGLIAGDQDAYGLGPRWRVLEPYDRILKLAHQDNKSFRELIASDLIVEDEIVLS